MIADFKESELRKWRNQIIKEVDQLEMDLQEVQLVVKKLNVRREILVQLYENSISNSPEQMGLEFELDRLNEFFQERVTEAMELKALCQQRTAAKNLIVKHIDSELDKF
ncbi:hypothetical protein [Paenibacillus sp. sgz500958]|uniref:hypothetical protein n=1 Tax=Paenibacillus sp. sgz500958 TaxID=3242475 RepID=UPI0036D2FF5C